MTSLRIYEVAQQWAAERDADARPRGRDYACAMANARDGLRDALSGIFSR